MPTLVEIQNLGTALAEAAQTEYEAWEQDENGWDEELGEGGICHLIADRMVDVLSNAGFDAVPTHSEGVGENHVWVTARAEDGVIMIDIPPSRYEVGSGFCWRKRPNIRLSADDVFISVVDPDPSKFQLYADVDDLGELDESRPTI